MLELSRGLAGRAKASAPDPTEDDIVYLDAGIDEAEDSVGLILI